MAQIENEQYKIIKFWRCPNCQKLYEEKKISIGLGGFHPKHIHCERGCGRYFSSYGNKILDWQQIRREK